MTWNTTGLVLLSTPWPGANVTVTVTIPSQPDGPGRASESGGRVAADAVTVTVAWAGYHSIFKCGSGSVTVTVTLFKGGYNLNLMIWFAQSSPRLPLAPLRLGSDSPATRSPSPAGAAQAAGPQCLCSMRRQRRRRARRRGGGSGGGRLRLRVVTRHDDSDSYSGSSLRLSRRPGPPSQAASEY